MPSWFGNEARGGGGRGGGRVRGPRREAEAGDLRIDRAYASVPIRGVAIAIAPSRGRRACANGRARGAGSTRAARGGLVTALADSARGSPRVSRDAIRAFAPASRAGEKNPRLLPRRNKQSRARGDWNGRRDALAPGSSASRRVRASRRGGSRAYLRHDGLALLRVRLDGGAVAADGHLEVLGRVQERAELLLLLQRVSFTMSPSACERVAGVERGRRATASWRATRAVAGKHRRLNASATSPEGARLSAGARACATSQRRASRDKKSQSETQSHKKYSTFTTKISVIVFRRSPSRLLPDAYRFSHRSRKAQSRAHTPPRRRALGGSPRDDAMPSAIPSLPPHYTWTPSCSAMWTVPAPPTRVRRAAANDLAFCRGLG